jgi:hypothetical protein
MTTEAFAWEEPVVTYIDGGEVSENEPRPPVLVKNAECVRLLACLAALGVTNFEVVVSYRSGYGMLVRLTPANFQKRVRPSARRHAAVRELQEALGKIVGQGVDAVINDSVVAGYDYVAVVAVWPSERADEQGLVATMDSFVPEFQVNNLHVRLI